MIALSDGGRMMELSDGIFVMLLSVGGGGGSGLFRLHSPARLLNE